MKPTEIVPGQLYKLRQTNTEDQDQETLYALFRRRGDTLFRVNTVFNDGVYLQAQSVSGKAGIGHPTSFQDLEKHFEYFEAEIN